MGGLIKFSEDYPKLREEYFSTIRRYDKGFKKEQEVTIKTPTKEFQAVIIVKFKEYLKNIPTDFLIEDTGRSTRDEAIKLLNSFYRKPIAEDEELTIYIFLRGDLE